MKFGIVVFPGSNCDRDMHDALRHELRQEVIMLWNKDSYLGIQSPYAYIIVMSLVDGFYPIISRWVIRWMGKKSTFGVYTPQLA